MFEPDARVKLMVKKLTDQIAQGNITKDWDIEFTLSIKKRVDMGIALTPKQLDTLEQVFERN